MQVLAGLQEPHLAAFGGGREDLREQPDAADQHRLVDEVEGEAVAPGEDAAASPVRQHGLARRSRRCRSVPQASAAGNARQHSAEPRKERARSRWSAALSRRGRATTSRMVEELPSEDRAARRSPTAAAGQRDSGRQAQEAEPEQARQRDLVQDAEEDEAARGMAR